MTALYRAYRPQRFEDVVGQEAVVRTLTNAIAAGSVAHAYLFTGPKGTGKTTMAKLLAKALNCEQGPTTSPCGECESCRSIAEGRSVDVAEIDAASNNSVQDVREKIVDTVSYRPAQGTRRVYILDEAHQLSTSAFNALLKTIEEPPDHVLFVFCTTENHKMMATVRDRCQRFTLAPPTMQQLHQVLRRVAEAEGITAEDDALAAVARVSQGSFRNALGTLEHLATAFANSFTLQDVLVHLGAFDEDVMFDAADSVLSGDGGRILGLVEQLSQNGSDLVQFAHGLAEHLRGVMLASQGVEAQTFAVSDLARLQRQGAAADVTRTVAAIDCINDALARIRAGSDARLALETGLMRATQGLGLPSLALRLAVLEHKVLGSVGSPLPGGTAPAASAAPPAPVAEQAQASAPPPPPPAVAAESPQPAAAPAAARAASVASASTIVPAPPAAAAGSDWWQQVLTASRADSPAMHAALVRLAAPQLSEDHVVIETSMAGVLRGKYLQSLQELVTAAVGRPVTVELRDAAPEAPAAPAEESPAAEVQPGVEASAPTPPERATLPSDEDLEGLSGSPLLVKAFNATEMRDPQGS